ncbi:MAG TPA: AzlC family ABC transporter permease [Clostridia bacterium]|nr:AzlC family ABC transporter permease [Clostridia bacterium]
MDRAVSLNSYAKGLKDGVPIGLGYLSVSFTFGIMAVNSGLPVWVAVLISMTNLTSAGQFAGIGLITASAPYLEMALTQFVINLRYSLMSLSVSQKADKSFGLLQRLVISFGITDEIFAVATGKPSEIGTRYMYGLITIPYIGWALGTFVGAAASTILPASVCSALNIAIYGMFIAIIIPPAKRSKPVLKVILLSVAISCLFRYSPVLDRLSGGFVIIICAVAASAAGALMFPVREAEDTENTESMDGTECTEIAEAAGQVETAAESGKLTETDNDPENADDSEASIDIADGKDVNR